VRLLRCIPARKSSHLTSSYRPTIDRLKNAEARRKVGRLMHWTNSLMDEVSGRYRVHTFSGAMYCLDLDRQEMRRMCTPDDLADERALRRDGDAVRLVQMRECTVGRAMDLLIDLAVPGVYATVRRSTVVTSIERDLADLDDDQVEL
jgi:hypothetical protein